MIQNRSMANYGLIIIDYLYKLMAKPMHHPTASKWFVHYVGNIGIPVINFQVLRHTNDTLLIS